MSVALIHSSVAIQNRNILTFQGQTVTIGLELRNNGVWQPRFLVDPSEAPLITLFNPYGDLIIDDDVMQRQSLGRWFYNYLTKHDDPLGLWTARFSALHIATQSRSDDIGVFLLVQGTFSVYTYFIIQDQEGTLWYWFVDNAGQAVASLQVPPNLARLAQAINAQGQVPSWLEITNQQSLTRYVYPNVLGEFIVDVVPPPLGVGYSNDVIFISTNGRRYIFTSDIVDQLVIEPI